MLKKTFLVFMLLVVGCNEDKNVSSQAIAIYYDQDSENVWCPIFVSWPIEDLDTWNENCAQIEGYEGGLEFRCLPLPSLRQHFDTIRMAIDVDETDEWYTRVWLEGEQNRYCGEYHSRIISVDYNYDSAWLWSYEAQ